MDVDPAVWIALFLAIVVVINVCPVMLSIWSISAKCSH